MSATLKKAKIVALKKAKMNSKAEINGIIQQAAQKGYNYRYPFSQNNTVFVNKATTVDVTFIIPVYNVERYIQECIDSLLSQETGYKYEILLIDDGSSDTSGIIVDRYSKQDGVRVFHHSANQGLSSARNTGLNNSCGKYVCFVDSDDFLEKNFIETLMKRATETDADIVKANYYKYYSDGTRTESGKYFNTNKSYQEGLGNDILIYTYAWGAIYKRELWERARFPEGYLFEDMTIAHLVFHSAKTFEYINMPLYNYRMDNTQSITSMKNNTPKMLDHAFLAYAVLYFMDENGMTIDKDILRITLREYGRIASIRIHNQYHKIVFYLGCCSISRIMERIPAVTINELPIKEQIYLEAFIKERYHIWKALSLIEKTKAIVTAVLTN